MKKLAVRTKNTKSIFVIIKPGFLPLCSKILQIFEEKGWNISQLRTKQLLLSEARALYSIHKNEDFYDDLCKYMSSGLTMAFIFSKNNATGDIFEETGKIKDIIRKKWGESDMRNVIHSSDSLEHMNKEAPIYFSGFLWILDRA